MIIYFLNTAQRKLIFFPPYWNTSIKKIEHKMDKDQYYRIIEHYEKCLFKFGPNYRGMDWPNQKDLNVRFQVMWELIKTCNDKKVTILDIGCGVGLFLDFFKTKKI